jgi:hypothetical protein
VVSKLAHDGGFWIENTSLPPSESLAVGVKLYWVPTVMPVMGVPLMVAVAAVVEPTSFAVAVAVGLTLTASPPPQAVRPNKMSANAPAALISLKSMHSSGRVRSGPPKPVRAG